ncbi:Amino acid transporter, transmembrane [Metarhizium robertsii ARSEF 23]|uniref:Amino acid transporter, transmembrane n=1 Tax=Metarhizium robertsii (strain ARSEF 23 / ATCC MYA-3075) TaxID=655844 RepID=E9EPF8_METRA|nr:Amino acid transporter, transmembrane [Metarhizium robertsii ARSEF 23]EFZ02428.2 Amino acid transporter, transmembrane [Metarhizium robertsii ARSEF 23]
MSKTSQDPHNLSDQIEPAASRSEREVIDTEVKTSDAVFGNITDDGPNYRNVGWLGTAALMMKTQIGLGVLSIPSVFDLMMKTQIGLGVLSIPSVFDTVGLIPGVILLLVIGTITTWSAYMIGYTAWTTGLIPGVILLLFVGTVTTWSAYMIGVFKLRHRQVYGIDDAGGLIFGRIGREVFGVAFTLFSSSVLTFASAAAMIGISVAFNALSTHGACTAVFVAVAAVFGFTFASIQTLGKISALAWIGVTSIVIAVFTVTIAVGVQGKPTTASQDFEGPWRTSIVIAVFTVTIAVGVQGKPSTASQDYEGPWSHYDYELFKNPTFSDALGAITTLIFAYAGTPTFFSIASEMRDPKHYTKALMMCQSVITVITLAYIVVGVVVYYFCGSYAASPALGSAGPLIKKKVAYGIALPGLLVTDLLAIHLAAKSIFVRVLRNSKHLASNTPKHWTVWLGSTFTITVVKSIWPPTPPSTGQFGWAQPLPSPLWAM